jgi:hypothetical protein
VSGMKTRLTAWAAKRGRPRDNSGRRLSM